MNRIVLAYSGGLDTSVAVKWLADKYEAEIVAVTMDQDVASRGCVPVSTRP